VTDQDPADRHRVVDYIAAMLAELAQMAGAQRYTTLAYLLEMARLEAEQVRNDELAELDRLAAE